MACRNLSKLEMCWQAIAPFQGFVPRISSSRCHEIRQHQHRHASNVVKSPFKDIEIPNILIPEMIWKTVDRYPEATALKCGKTGRNLTYSQVYKLSQRFSNSMRKAGFGKGDVMGLVLPNCPDFATITLGALEADLAVSLLNHSYTADEICHQLKDSGSSCVVTAHENLSLVLLAIKKIEEASQKKPIKMVVVVDLQSLDNLPAGVRRYSEMIADDVDDTRNSSQKSKPDDLAILPYSSGTTGLSKGVCLSHRNILCNILQYSTPEAGKNLYTPEQGQDTLLGVLPFYHIYGLTVILANSLVYGCKTITFPKFDQHDVPRAIREEKISVMMLVPPLVLFLGSSSDVTAECLKHVRLVFSGAAPLGATDMDKLKAKLPKDSILSQAYGMTELSPVALFPRAECSNLATVGIPTPNTLAKIVDPNTREALGPNQSGELCFKGPQVMLGYHNNPKATAEMIDEDGWLHSGDIGYYDNDGLFYIQDRLKELIKVKGFQVPPAELEEVLRAHPLVSDAGVIGVPDPRTGEAPIAYIVQKDKKLTVDDVKAYLAEKLSRHKQVADVIFIDSIPKSAAGKILRKELREMYKKVINKEC